MGLKKILFVCTNLNYGGVPKSLLELFKHWDGGGAEIWLMTKNLDAPLVPQLPEYVHLIKTPWQLDAFFFRRQNLGCGVRAMWKNPGLLVRYLVAVLRVLLKLDNKDIAKKKFWKKYNHKFDFLREHYGEFDTAISYVGPQQMWNEFVIDCIGAKNNISWVHGDYQAFGIKCAEEKDMLRRYDRIVCVAEHVRQRFLEEIPDLEEKTYALYNLVDVDQIHELASKPVLEHETRFTIVSVARLSPEKGLDLAVPAIARLVREGYDIAWYIVGWGNEEQRLRNMIEQEKMQDHIFLLGAQENPYSFMKRSDLILQPSRSEGRSIVLEEAKCLSCAILTTEYPSVSESVVDGVEGMVVLTSSDGVYQGLKQLLDQPELREKYQKNLSGYEPDLTVLDRLNEWVKE